MPITQDRMQQLIAAGQDYRLALEKFLQRVQEAYAAEPQSPTLKWLAQAPMNQLQSLLADPIHSPMTLALEAQHHKFTAWRNQRKRAAQQGPRAGRSPHLRLPLAPFGKRPAHERSRTSGPICKVAARGRTGRSRRVTMTFSHRLI